ncbi:tRNA (carboxymethyluridine(34)-5-O)-methyltransferase [Bertholletia excelsa]
MEMHRTLINDVFGESSDREGDESQNQQPVLGDLYERVQSPSVFGESSIWERVNEINGLWVCRDFLSPEQQSSLLSAIENEGWFTEASHNQAMRFGDLPAWATELADLIREVVHYSDYMSEFTDATASSDDKNVCLFPSNLLWREPLFDQLIANVYQPGEGICAHVDLMRFEDGIAIISLESSCVMHFSQVETKAGSAENELERAEAIVKIPVNLMPGSLLLMWGEARYLWKHEINRKPGFQKWEGKDIDQQKRTSITLRKLCPNK